MEIKVEINVKCLEQFLAQTKLSVNVHYYYNLLTWEANCSLAESLQPAQDIAQSSTSPGDGAWIQKMAMIYGLELRLQQQCSYSLEL